MRALFGCEESGECRRAFRALGWDAWSCDLLPASDNSPYHIQDDVLKHVNDGWDFAFFFPPCTDLAVSGARWFAEKRADGRQQKSIDFFMRCADAVEEIGCGGLENPIGIMSSIYRKPNQIIQPWWFGHGETKATCLWLKKLPILRPTNIVDGREQRIWRMAPSERRSIERSKTFPGIAAAMAEQWTKFFKEFYGYCTNTQTSIYQRQSA